MSKNQKSSENKTKVKEKEKESKFELTTENFRKPFGKYQGQKLRTILDDDLNCAGRLHLISLTHLDWVDLNQRKIIKKFLEENPPSEEEQQFLDNKYKKYPEKAFPNKNI